MIETLRTMAVGERAWFCYRREAQPCPLMLMRVGDDPDMSGLREVSRSVEAPSTSIPRMGVCFAQSDGTLLLTSANMREEDYRDLAGWASASVERYPEVARLKNARLAKTNADGLVLSVTEDPSAWDTVPEPDVPGTMTAAVRQIRGMELGERRWIWGGSAGDSRVLIVAPFGGEAEYQAFTRQVETGIRRLSGTRKMFIGQLHRTASGLFAFSTGSELEEASSILESLCEAMAELRDVLGSFRVLHSGTSGFDAIYRYDGASERGRWSSVVELLRGGEVLWFEFSSSELWIGRKDERASRSSEGGGVRGKVSMRGGGVCFRAKMPVTSLLGELATWVEANRDETPVLAVFRGAWAQTIGPDGKVVHTYRDDSLWD